MQRRVLYGVAIGVVALLLAYVAATVSMPVWISVEVKEEAPLKYRVYIKPLYRAYFDKPGPPYIVVVLDNMRRIGVPPMGNVQVWAKGPNVGKYEIRDFEARGNVIRIPVNGDFRKALDDWLNSNATDIEVPIEIDIWYGDTHIGFAAAHYVPREVGNMERGEYVIKAAVYVTEKPIKKVNNTAAHFAPGLDCNYEWRYNTTLLDTRRIPLFLLYNQYNYSGLVSVLGFITHVSSIYIGFTMLLGYEIGDFYMAIKEMAAIEYDVKSDDFQVAFGDSVMPEGWYTAFLPGRLAVYKYDEYYVCRDGDRVVSTIRTGNIKIQTDVLYLPQGAVSTIDDPTPQKELLDTLSSNANVIVIRTYRLDPGRDLYLERELFALYSSRGKKDIKVGAPLGAVELLRAAAKGAGSNPALLIILISFEVEDAGRWWRGPALTIFNKGGIYGPTYSVPEFIDVYGVRVKIVARDGSSRQQYLPLAVVVAR